METEDYSVRIGILGGRKLATAQTGAIGYALGREVVKHGHVLVTGGARGSGGEACRGASAWLSETGTEAGAYVVSFVPHGKTAEHGYGRVEHRGFTWKDRRGLLVLEGDFFFVVGGGEGTADEVSAARRERVAALPLGDSGGVAGELWAYLAGLATPCEREVLETCGLKNGKVEELAERAVAIAEEYEEQKGGGALRTLMQRFWEGEGPRLGQGEDG